MQSSVQLKGMFVLLGLVLGVLFILGVRIAWQRTGAGEEDTHKVSLRALLSTALWLTITMGAAAAHRLRFEPPTFMLFMLIALAGSFAIGLSPMGRRLAAGLPLALLVGVQGFRLPLELAMHRAYSEGIMPVQMSYSGYNFDIVTGALAIVLAIVVALGYAGRGLVRGLVLLWNCLGSLLLANVLIIAILSTPLIRAFDTEPLNTWVTQPPYVWLPAVMVPMALIGHIVVFRRLRMESAFASGNRAIGQSGNRE